MGEIHAHEFMTLDGVVDAPTWTFEYGFHPRMGEVIGAVTERSRGILFGRATYEMFEPAWSTRTVEDDPGAPFFNDTTKYVVSGTLTSATWRNSEIIGPYDAEAIRRLKEQVDGDLYVSGSITLVQALLADGLVDELRPVRLPAHPWVRPAPLPRERRTEQVLARGVRVVRQRCRAPRLPTAALITGSRRRRREHRSCSCLPGR